MRLGILGPLLVIDDAGAEVAVAAARQRTLLAALLVKANRIVPAAELAEIVWDGTPPPGVGSTLRSYVMRLRHAVGPAVAARIRTGDPGYTSRKRLIASRCSARKSCASGATPRPASGARHSTPTLPWWRFRWTSYAAWPVFSRL